LKEAKVHWVLVQQDTNTSEVLAARNGVPLTSPRFEDLSEAAQAQVKKTMASIRALIKADVVPVGNIRIAASGYAHHEEKMPIDEADFVALNIARRA